MLVPLTAAAKAVLFRPQKMATAYDALPGSSTEAGRRQAGTQAGCRHARSARR